MFSEFGLIGHHRTLTLDMVSSASGDNLLHSPDRKPRSFCQDTKSDSRTLICTYHFGIATDTKQKSPASGGAFQTVFISLKP
jgi:hypothetical protein